MCAAIENYSSQKILQYQSTAIYGRKRGYDMHSNRINIVLM